MVEVAFDLVVLYLCISTTLSLSLSIHFVHVDRTGGKYQEPQTAEAAETIPAHQDVAVTDSPVPPPRMKM